MSIFAPQAKNLLFKYCHSRKVASEHSVFTSTGISLRATPPNAFNDPFEFASNLLTDDERREIERLAKLDDLGPGTEAILSGTLLTYQDTASRWLRLREQISQRNGVVCLSACWDDILMWSHYADEHRGFAVAIDRDHQYVQKFHFEPWNTRVKGRAAQSRLIMSGKVSRLLLTMYMPPSTPNRWIGATNTNGAVFGRLM